MTIPTASIIFVSLFYFLKYYSFVLIARILLSWFPNVNLAQQFISVVSPVTDPYLNLFRFIPPIGAIDISSFVALIALNVLTNAVGQLV